MSNIPTPETDAHLALYKFPNLSVHQNWCDFARDLERRLVEANWLERERNQTANVFMVQVKNLQAEIHQCKLLLGYDDGDLLDNVTRFKTYADGEIALLRANNEEAIREHERMAGSLSIAQALADNKTAYADGMRIEMNRLRSQVSNLLIEQAHEENIRGQMAEENAQLKQALSHYSNHPAPHGTDLVSLERDSKMLDWLLALVMDKGTNGLQSFLWTNPADKDPMEENDVILDRAAIKAAMTKP